MNREILFRGKRVDNGEWVAGFYGVFSFGSFPCKPGIIIAEDAANGYWHYEKVDPSTVCQFTGLTDKNGVKIFEGDIMRFNAYGLCRAGTVEYQDAAFCILCQKPDAFPFLDDAIKRHEAESIGNIFDNPELLEENNT